MGNYPCVYDFFFVYRKINESHFQFNFVSPVRRRGWWNTFRPKSSSLHVFKRSFTGRICTRAFVKIYKSAGIFRGKKIIRYSFVRRKFVIITFINISNYMSPVRIPRNALIKMTKQLELWRSKRFIARLKWRTDIYEFRAKIHSNLLKAVCFPRISSYSNLFFSICMETILVYKIY